MNKLEMIPHNLAVLVLAALHVQSFVPKFPGPPLVTRLQVSMHNRRTAVDFYAILEVSPHASADEIKRAYRKMAKRYHPDSNGGEDTSESFQQVNRAYEVLSDPRLKSKYDMFGFNGIGTSAASDEIKVNRVYSGSSSTRRGMPADNFGDNVGGIHSNPADISNGYMGKNMNPSDVMNRRGKKLVGDDLQYSMSIDFETAIFGGKETIWIDHLETCEYCMGEGVKTDRKDNSCDTCGGSGFLVELSKTSFGSLHSQRTCHGCRGSGKKFEEYCEYCFGRGSVSRSKRVDVTIPAGVEGYTRLRIRGEGNAGPKGGPAGDLFLFLKVEPHPVFRRDGATIHSNCTIDYIDAILGNTVDTPVVGGQQVSMEVPEGTQHDEKIRLRGHGARSLIGSSGTRGDHFVTVQLEIPDAYDQEEEEILLKLRDLEAKRKAEAPFTMDHVHNDDDGKIEKEVDDEDLDDFAASFSSHFSAKKRYSSFSGESMPGTIRVDSFEKKYVSDDVFTASSVDDKAVHDEKVEVLEVSESPLNTTVATKNATSETTRGGSSPNPTILIGTHGNDDDKAKKDPFFVETTHELDKLRELLQAPVKPSKKAEEAARKAREEEEANAVVAHELEKLRELLHRPMETTKASQTAAKKKQEMEEANALVAHELEKLRELLHRPVVSPRKNKQKSNKEKTNEMVANELDKLRELLYRPADSAKEKSVSSKMEDIETTNEMVAHELEKLTELLYAPIEPPKKSVKSTSSKSKNEKFETTPEKEETTTKLEHHDTLKAKPFSTRGSLSAKSNVPVDPEESLVAPVKAQGVAQGVRISAEIRLEPDEETADSSTLHEIKGETIQATVNSKDSKILKSSPLDIAVKDEPKKIESLQSSSSMEKFDETALDSQSSERSPDPLVNDDPTIEPEVVDGVKLPTGQAEGVSNSRSQSSAPAPPTTNEGSVVDDIDERSYAWEEITADSWRRREASDPVIRTDGRKFEEMLFSIFKL